MKRRRYFSPFGSIAAILLLLMPGADSRAQDIPPHIPRAAATTWAHTVDLAACSPDGEFYAVATQNGRIKYARTQDGATLRTFYQCHPRAMVFSPDGRLLAVAAGSNGCPARLKVCQVADGAVLCKVETKMESDPLLSFSPDGLLLVSTGEGSRINLWQMPKGTLKWSATISPPVSRLAFQMSAKLWSRFVSTAASSVFRCDEIPVAHQPSSDALLSAKKTTR